MGLIKAGLGSLGGVLADQWKEFFTCDAMPKEVLARKGQKKTSGRSSNTKGSDNVISNGSGLIVADGQCAIITDQGVVAEICAEPGEYTYNSQTEPSIFAGKFGDSLKRTFKEIGKRFTYGGEPAKDQRVYYFNTKEMMENPFGTASALSTAVSASTSTFLFAAAATTAMSSAIRSCSTPESAATSQAATICAPRSISS